MVAFEEEYHKSHVSVSEYLQTCRHHMAAQTQKGEETCVAMKQLMDVQETAKMVMLTELEGVKTWAARNLARLKKRLEVWCPPPARPPLPASALLPAPPCLPRPSCPPPLPASALLPAPPACLGRPARPPFLHPPPPP